MSGSSARLASISVAFVAVVAAGCGDEAAGSPARQPDASSHVVDVPMDSGTGPVTTPPEDAGSDATPPPVTADAGGHDAGVGDAASAVDAAPARPSCGADEMPCGDECIPVIEPKLAAIESRIFAVSCGLSTSCHRPPSAKEGLDLSTADSTFSFVDQPASQMPSAKLFDTGSPEDSYVLRKLRGMRIAEKATTGVAATQMPPPPSTPLCAEKIDVIEAWVRAGASR